MTYEEYRAEVIFDIAEQMDEKEAGATWWTEEDAAIWAGDVSFMYAEGMTPGRARM